MKLAKTPSSAAKVPKKARRSKTATPKKAPPAGDGVLKIGAVAGEKLEAEQVLLAVRAVKKLIKPAEEKLFSEEGQKIHVQVAAIKLPRESRSHVVNLVLPKPYLLDPSEVCLFVKDKERGIKADHEPGAREFASLLDGKGCRDLVNEVIPLRQLKVEYKAFEAKSKLSNRFDKFLADDRILRFLPKFLGKPFYKKKRFPVPVNLTAKDLKSELSKALRTTQLPLSHHGTSSQVTVGHSGMSDGDLAANVVAVSEGLARRYPGGWKNIRAVYLKAERSVAVPMHVSTMSANDVGFVDADLPTRTRERAEPCELSTQPGVEVTVLPGGAVKVRKTGDPDWDGDKDEPNAGEEEDEEEVSDGEEKKLAAAKAKKRKLDKKAETKTKKKKKEEDSSEEDSEDEEIAQAEMKYLGKHSQASDGEEEEESGAEEEDDQEEDGGEEEDEEDDSGEGEGEEEEEESVYDDDEELDEEDVLVDDDDSAEESDGDEDGKLILKRKGDEEESD